MTERMLVIAMMLIIIAACLFSVCVYLAMEDPAPRDGDTKAVYEAVNDVIEAQKELNAALDRLITIQTGENDGT